VQAEPNGFLDDLDFHSNVPGLRALTRIGGLMREIVRILSDLESRVKETKLSRQESRNSVDKQGVEETLRGLATGRGRETTKANPPEDAIDRPPPADIIEISRRAYSAVAAERPVRGRSDSTGLP